MSKIPSLSYKRLICLFEKAGFVYSRTKGDHLIYWKQGNIRPLVIPKYEEVPVFIIKNLLRSAGLTRGEFFDLLVQC